MWELINTDNITFLIVLDIRACAVLVHLTPRPCGNSLLYKTKMKQIIIKPKITRACGITVLLETRLYKFIKPLGNVGSHFYLCSIRVTASMRWLSLFSHVGAYFHFNCFYRLYGTSGACAVCAKLIPATELVMKVLGKVYHLHCFTCTTCHNQLVSGDRFHVVNGRLFCENDDPNLLKQIHAAKQTVSLGLS